MHFVTYGGGPYAPFASNLVKSALAVGGFSVARAYGPMHLDSEFARLNSKILSCARGGGYWLFKPYIIIKELLSLCDGDCLCYCDSLFSCTGAFGDFARRALLHRDVAIASNKLCEPEFMEAAWTKADVFHALDVDHGIHSSTPQCWGAFMLIQKSFMSICFVSQWLAYCQDYRLISDSPSILQNGPDFVEHHHDQSILSLLAEKHDIRFFRFPKDSPLRNLRAPKIP
jgi:hypothetical protein